MNLFGIHHRDVARIVLKPLPHPKALHTLVANVIMNYLVKLPVGGGAFSRRTLNIMSHIFSSFEVRNIICNIVYIAYNGCPHSLAGSQLGKRLYHQVTKPGMAISEWCASTYLSISISININTSEQTENNLDFFLVMVSRLSW